MPADNLNDLAAFVAVAKERNFTRAAAKLGLSQSALSQTIRGLEDRLGLRLLTRTTRSVAPTEAGDRLLRTIGPRLDEIHAELAALSDLRNRPSGTVRLATDEHAATMVLWPALENFLPRYPDITVELVINNGLTDIVADRCDAGVRSGDIVDRDMIAVPIGPDMRMAVVGAPDYFADHAAPTTPEELTGHRCINLRLPTYGGLYAWEFEEDSRDIRVRVEGQVILNSIGMMLRACLAGFGLAFLAEDQVRSHVERGELVRVLAKYCPAFSGHHLYYPSRKQPSSAFSILVDALRYRKT